MQHLREGYHGAGGLWAQPLLTKWQKLGDSTKALLFHPMQVQHLDNFFLLAKKIAESPSPKPVMLSMGGAAGGGLLFHPAVGVPLNIGAGVLSKLLYSPRGVNLLTKGPTMTAGRTPRAVALSEKIINLVTAAGSDASQSAQSSSTSARQ